MTVCYPYDDNALESTGFVIEAPKIGFFTQLWYTLRRKYSLGSPLQVLTSIFPILNVFENGYSFSDLSCDFIAGITLSVVLIPQALAYAPLAGLKAQYGLYSAFASSIIYCLFGTTRELSVGPFALVSIMVGEAIAQMYPHLPNADSADYEQYYAERLAYTLAVGFACGVWLLGMAVLKLGWIIDFISTPAVKGLVMATALTVSASQFGSLFGVKTDSGSFLSATISLLKNIAKTNVHTLAIGLIALIILFIADWYSKFKKLKIPLPAQITMVIISTLLSAMIGFHDRWNVSVVGDIKMGFPAPTMVDFSLLVEPSYWMNGFLFAIVGFVISSSVSQQMINQYHYNVNFNSELFALGSCSAIGAFFNCYLSSASLSRTMVVNSAKPSTRLWNISSILVVGCVIFFLASLLHHLPKCILAAIVISSFRGNFMNILEWIAIWKQSPRDAFVYLLTLFATVCVSMQAGLVAAVVGSILSVVISNSMFEPVYLRQVPTTQRFIEYRRLPWTLFYHFLHTCYMSGGELPRHMQHLTATSANQLLTPGDAPEAATGNGRDVYGYHQVDDEDGLSPTNVNEQDNATTSEVYQRHYGSSDQLAASSSTADFGSSPQSSSSSSYQHQIELSPSAPNRAETFDFAQAGSSSIGGLPVGLIAEQPQAIEDPRIVVLSLSGPISFINQVPFVDHLTQLVAQQSAFIHFYGSRYTALQNDIYHTPTLTDLRDTYKVLLPECFNINVIPDPALFLQQQQQQHQRHRDLPASASLIGLIGIYPYMTSSFNEFQQKQQEVVLTKTHQHVISEDDVLSRPQLEQTPGAFLPAVPHSELQQHLINTMLAQVLANVSESVILNWQTAIILDSVSEIDITARTSLAQFLKTNKSVLLLFTNAGFATMTFANGLGVPTNFTFENILTAYSFARLLLNIAAIGRIQQHKNQTAAAAVVDDVESTETVSN